MYYLPWIAGKLVRKEEERIVKKKKGLLKREVTVICWGKEGKNLTLFERPTVGSLNQTVLQLKYRGGVLGGEGTTTGQIKWGEERS